MSEEAITIEALGKRYRIGKRAGYKTFRETLVQAASSPFRKLSGGESATQTSFWALKDVNFSVNKGEVVGIIGRNGAGKSTLLKILCRITEPTCGKVQITGRVGSLLEVGTGFHPELTGRENVYLNGAILGMKRREIAAKFDEIVAFSEIEKFLDTPVKRYSSGMYTRLAFAVAAHLEPEILVVDEVLAVGDAEFQKKCLGKMGDVARHGRTVLFVSHNMRAVEQLCKKVVLLEQGQVKSISNDVPEVLRQYLVGDQAGNQSSLWTAPADGSGSGNNSFRLTKFFLSDASGNLLPPVQRSDADVWLQVEGEISDYDTGLTIGYALINEDGQHIYWSYDCDSPPDRWPKLQPGRVVLRTKLPRRLLAEGVYRIEMAANLYYRNWILEPGRSAPSILWQIQGGLTDSSQWSGRRGVLNPIFEWTSQSGLRTG